MARRRCPGGAAPRSRSSPGCRAARAASSGCGTGSPTAARPATARRPSGRGASCGARGFGSGIADRSATVYGWRGLLVELLDRRRARRSCPRYITADPVAEVLDDRQVVADEQVGQVEVAAQVEEQVQDLALDRHVERRHGLVADDEVRARGRAPGRSRCAGAGRRRTRAGSAGCSRAAGRRARASPRPSCRAPCGPSSPWASRPSPMMSLTGIRGLSDPNGSWKMICILRRSGRSSSALMCGDVPAVERRPCPAVGSIRRRSDPAEGRLAAAGLADEAERLARR